MAQLRGPAMRETAVKIDCAGREPFGRPGGRGPGAAGAGAGAPSAHNHRRRGAEGPPPRAHRPSQRRPMSILRCACTTEGPACAFPAARARGRGLVGETPGLGWAGAARGCGPSNAPPLRAASDLPAFPNPAPARGHSGAPVPLFTGGAASFQRASKQPARPRPRTPLRGAGAGRGAQAGRAAERIAAEARRKGGARGALASPRGPLMGSNGAGVFWGVS